MRCVLRYFFQIKPLLPQMPYLSRHIFSLHSIEYHLHQFSSIQTIHSIFFSLYSIETVDYSLKIISSKLQSWLWWSWNWLSLSPTWIAELACNHSPSSAIYVEIRLWHNFLILIYEFKYFFYFPQIRVHILCLIFFFNIWAWILKLYSKNQIFFILIYIWI